MTDAAPPPRALLPRLKVLMATEQGILEISAPVTGISIDPPLMQGAVIKGARYLCEPVSHYVTVRWSPARSGEGAASHVYEDVRTLALGLTTARVAPRDDDSNK